MTSKSSSKTAKQDTVTISPYLMRRHREQLAEWLKANDVDPSSVSADYAIRIEDGVITYRAFVLDDDGQPYAWPADPYGVATEERTARCAAPPPELTLTPSDTRGT